MEEEAARAQMGSEILETMDNDSEYVELLHR